MFIMFGFSSTSYFVVAYLFVFCSHPTVLRFCAQRSFQVGPRRELNPAMRKESTLI